MTTTQANLKTYLLQLINIHNDLSNNNEAYDGDLFDPIYNILRQLNYTTYNQVYFWQEYEMFKDSGYDLMEFLSMFTPYDNSTFSEIYILSAHINNENILESLINACDDQFPDINADDNGYEKIIDKSKVLENLLNYDVINKINLSGFNTGTSRINRQVFAH